MKKAITMLTVAAALILSVFPTPGVYAKGTGIANMQAEDPLSVARAFVDAMNSHDIDAVVDLFDEEAVITSGSPDETPSTYSGRDEIRDFMESTVSADITSEIVGQPQVAGAQVDFVLRLTGNDIKEIGLDHMDFMFSMVVREGKIQTLTIGMSPEEWARVNEATRRGSEGSVPRGMPVGMPGSSESGGRMPVGMPRTGNGSHTLPVLPLVLLSVGLISTGLVLSRRRAWL